MFYLETKDGDRFFTDPKSDDKSEFEKIIESKMGSQAVELMNELIEEARNDGEDSVWNSSSQTLVYYEDISNVVYSINEVICELASNKTCDTSIIDKLIQIKNTLNEF